MSNLSRVVRVLSMLALLTFASPSLAGLRTGQPPAPAQQALRQRPAELVRDIETRSNLSPRVSSFGAEVLIDYGDPSPAEQQLGFYRYLSDGTTTGTRSANEIVTSFTQCTSDEKLRLGSTIFIFCWDANTGSYDLWGGDGRVANSTKLVENLSFGSPVIVGQQVLLFVSEPNSFVGSYRLWRSDGTAAGSRPVAPDMPRFSNISNLVSIGDQGFFIGTDSDSQALWRSDGTAANTTKIVELSQPGLLLSYSGLSVAGGQIFFTSSRADSGACSICGLYVSDGSAAGTRLIKIPQPTFSLSSLGDRVIFELPGEDTNVALWASDGTESGTQQFASVPEFQGEPLVIGSQLYLRTWGGLYRSDGSAAGTSLVDPDRSFGQEYIALGDRLLYIGCATAVCSLRAVDPAASSPTVLVTDLYTDIGPKLEWEAVNDSALFRLCTSATGCEPWISDGTLAGTFALGDFNPGLPFSLSNDRPSLHRLGNRILMVLNDGEHGQQIWVSDGSKLGTKELIQFNPPFNGSSNPQLVATLGGRAIFISNALSSYEGSYELWSSDGSAAGTRKIDDYRNIDYTGPVVAGGKLFYAGYTDLAVRLLVSDGLGPGTPIFTATANFGSFGPRLTAAGSRVFFNACGPDDQCKLYVSDGTPAGTLAVADLSSFAYEISAVGGRAFAWAIDREAGRFRLYVSDGTPAGSREVSSFINVGDGRLLNHNIGTVGDKLIFEAGYPAYEAQPFRLYSSDGTPEGTQPISGPLSAGISASAQIDGALFFSIGNQLWRSDGSAAGTVKIADIGSEQNSSVVDIAGGGGAIFLELSAGGGRQLWFSDGTAAGTRKLADLQLESSYYLKTLLLVVDGVLLFRDEQRLWRSDGSSAGTYVIQSLEATDAIMADERIFLAADDGLVGSELWAIPAGAYLAGSASGGVAPGGTHLLGVTVGETWRPQTALAASGGLTLSITLDPLLSYLGNDAGLSPLTVTPTLSFALPASAQPFTIRQIGLRLSAPTEALGTSLPVQISLSASGDPDSADNSVSGTIRLGRLLYLPQIQRNR